MKLLHIDSSITGDRSVSRRLTAAVVDEWRGRVPGLDVTYRDLAADPLDHLSGVVAAAQRGGEAPAEFANDLRASNAALDEFLAADVVVLGAPMYNFTVSTQLKAWIDRLAVAGKTFRYTENGSEGLAGGKKVIVVSARGGDYAPGTPGAAADFQEPFLRTLFGFFGIDDVDYVRAEGVAISPERRAQAIADAERQITERLAA